MTMFGAKPGRSSDYAGQGDQSKEAAGNPPSDAKARMTANDWVSPLLKVQQEELFEDNWRNG